MPVFIPESGIHTLRVTGVERPSVLERREAVLAGAPC